PPAVYSFPTRRSSDLRLDRLHAEGVVTRQQRDEAQVKSVDAEQQALAARALYDQALAGAREQDRSAAQAQVRQAEGALAEVQAADRKSTRLNSSHVKI